MFQDTDKRLLQPGTVGVIPTDTVYGVVAVAADRQAVARLYRLKERDGGKPGTLIAADRAQLEALGLKHRYLTAVEQFWPGAVSVIIPCGPELAYLHQGKNGLAVRIPDDEQLRKLLSTTGPLLTSSANHPDKPTATTVEQAKHYFDDQVDFYIDGGDLSSRAASTVIRVLDDAIEVVREGAVKIPLS